MLNAKQRRLSLIFGLGAFAVLMCLCAYFNFAEAPADPEAPLAWIALALLCTVTVGIGAWVATLPIFPGSESQSMVFLTAIGALILFMAVMARIETGVQILFAFLTGRQAFILLCAHLQERAPRVVLPSARLIK
ncbi:MAG: hypothetical protein QY323_03585 [Patescibacteria group bacterium]|nr:MAG: hypothetical protein QY323_03585 [Patescibacteria group bacterium]